LKAGITALIYAGAWLSNRFDLEVMSCGRSADAPLESLKLEMCGRFLAYDLTLDGDWIFVSAQPMDKGDPLELLLRIEDSLENWRTVVKLISACEHNRIKALFPRPLEIGGTGPNSFVIGDL
jgi:hypothetical protein